MYIVKRYVNNTDLMSERMNEMEADGWTVVSVTCDHDGNHITFVLVTYHK